MCMGFPGSSTGKESACNGGDPDLIPESGRSSREGIGYPLQYSVFLAFPCGSAGKESDCNMGDPGLIPGSGRSTGEGIGDPLQYSWASLVAQLVKIHLKCKRPGFNPWVGKNSWRREGLTIPVFWPGEFHGL